jgi:hypothetical protein
MTPAIVRAIWESLSPDERRGKPPKPVRIAALRKREVLALARVAGGLK